MSELQPSEIFLRIAAAFAAGLLLGWERESRGRPAGLRTTILTCMASAMSMIISEALFGMAADGSSGAWRPDPARLGQGILTGIGFLGAGTIIRQDNFVRGVTTAATLWFAAVLGLALGSGLYLLSIVSVFAALLVLLGLPKIEKFIPAHFYAAVSVEGTVDLDEEQIRLRLAALGAKSLKLSLTLDLTQNRKTIQCDVRFKRDRKLQLSSLMVRDLATMNGVQKVSCQ